jgi:hypothetical protein
VRLFAVTCYAEGYTDGGRLTTAYFPTCIVAEDERTADTLGYDECKKHFPSEKGYTKWHASSCEAKMGLFKVGEQIYKLSLREVQPENEEGVK